MQPVLRELTPAFGYKQYNIPYHPGALKFFKETQYHACRASVSEERIVPTRRSSPPPRRGRTFSQRISCKPCWSPALSLWVLDVPRRYFDLALYTEQLLVVCLGLTHCAVLRRSGDEAEADAISTGAASSRAAAIGAYIAYRHPNAAARFRLSVDRQSCRRAWRGRSSAADYGRRAGSIGPAASSRSRSVSISPSATSR